MHSDWQCERCGSVDPLNRVAHNNRPVLEALRDRLYGADDAVPLWCPWPLPRGWTVAGSAWAGDDRSGPRATALALTGPAPLVEGPGEVVLVAENPGVGLGMGLAGLPDDDAGDWIARAMAGGASPAKVRADGHPTPLWAIGSLDDRAALAGEARGRWLVAITWPPEAGYLFTESIMLRDLVEALPSELVFGAPSLHL